MIFLTAWTGGPPHISNNTPKTFKELPVMRVNVYMMGREEVDESISVKIFENIEYMNEACLLYTSPSPRDRTRSRMPSSA